MSANDELSRWNNNARHAVGALITACGKLRDAVREHDAVDEWLRSTEAEDVPVKEGNEWAARDIAASDAMGAAITEIVERLAALDEPGPTYRSRAESEPLFAGPQGEPAYHPLPADPLLAKPEKNR